MPTCLGFSCCVSAARASSGARAGAAAAEFADFAAAGVGGDIFCAVLLPHGPDARLTAGGGRMTAQLNKNGALGGRCNALAWAPDAPQGLLSAHADGCLYLWDVSAADAGPAAADAQAFVPLERGEAPPSFCGARSAKSAARARWHVSRAALTAIAFSPSAAGAGHAALALADAAGVVRVLTWPGAARPGEMVSLCCVRSYYSAVRALAWSPDSRFVAFGGEADLVEVLDVMAGGGRYAHVCAWGEGQHSSWVEAVAWTQLQAAKAHKAEDEDEDGGNALAALRVVSIGQDGRTVAWALPEELCSTAAAQLSPPGVARRGSNCDAAEPSGPRSRRDIARLVPCGGGRSHSFPGAALACDEGSGACVAADVSGHVVLLQVR